MHNEDLVKFVEETIGEHELGYYITGLQMELEKGTHNNLPDTELVAKIAHIHKAIQEVGKFYSNSINLLNSYVLIAEARKLLSIIGNKNN